MADETKVEGTKGIPDAEDKSAGGPGVDSTNDNFALDIGDRLNRLITEYNLGLDQRAADVMKGVNARKKKKPNLKEAGLLEEIEADRLNISPEDLSRVTNYFIDNVLPSKKGEERAVVDSFVRKVERLLDRHPNPSVASLALNNLSEVYRHLSPKQIQNWSEKEREVLQFGTDDQRKEFYSLRGQGALALYQKGRKWPTAIVAGLVGAAALGSFWLLDSALNPRTQELRQCQYDQNNLAVCKGERDKLNEDLAGCEKATEISRKYAAICDDQSFSCLEEKDDLALASFFEREAFPQLEKDYASCQADLGKANTAKHNCDKAYLKSQKDFQGCSKTNLENALALADCQQVNASLNYFAANPIVVAPVEPAPAPAVVASVEPGVPAPLEPAALTLPLAEPVPTNIYYPKIRSALGIPETERPKALASIVAEYLQNNGGRVIVDGRNCQEALTSLYNNMLSTGISEKKSEVLEGFVIYGKDLCGTINPDSGRVVFKIVK